MECKRCLKTFSTLALLKRHLSRKNVCSAASEEHDVSASKLLAALRRPKARVNDFTDFTDMAKWNTFLQHVMPKINEYIKLKPEESIPKLVKDVFFDRRHPENAVITVEEDAGEIYAFNRSSQKWEPAGVYHVVDIVNNLAVLQQNAIMATVPVTERINFVTSKYDKELYDKYVSIMKSMQNEDIVKSVVKVIYDNRSFVESICGPFELLLDE